MMVIVSLHLSCLCCAADNVSTPLLSSLFLFFPLCPLRSVRWNGLLFHPQHSWSFMPLLIFLLIFFPLIECLFFGLFANLKPFFPSFFLWSLFDLVVTTCIVQPNDSQRGQGVLAREFVYVFRSNFHILAAFVLTVLSRWLEVKVVCLRETEK